MARQNQSTTKPTRTRPSQRTSATETTRVTRSFPNGAQALEFRVGLCSSPMPAQPAQPQPPGPVPAADSPFKRRTRRTATNTPTPIAPVSLDGLQTSPAMVLGSESEAAIGDARPSTCLPSVGTTAQPAPSANTLALFQVRREPSLEHDVCRSPSTPTCLSGAGATELATLQEEFENFNLDDVLDSDMNCSKARATATAKVTEDTRTTSDHSAGNPDTPQFRSTASPSSLHVGPPQQAEQKANQSPSGRKQLAKDVHHFLQEDPRDPEVRFCTLCLLEKKVVPSRRATTFGKSTATGTIRRHLYENHLADWVNMCDSLKIPITAKLAMPLVEEFRLAQNPKYTKEAGPEDLRREFSKEAFVEAILEWVISDDQSLRVIDNKHLRAVFLMLRSELRDSDIPSRSTLKRRVEQAFEQYLKQLEDDMSRALGKISYTMDMWSDPNMSPFMAVTAHWIEGETTETVSMEFVALRLRTELIGFINVPERHTGDHLSEAFLSVVDRLRVAYKIGWITLDNASSNDTFATAMQRELSRRRIPFNFAHRRVRCFPHVVNLACEAVLNTMTATEYAKRSAPDYVPPSSASTAELDGAGPGILDALQRDPIATLRSLIRAIRVSSLRRHAFSNTLKAMDMKVLNLLRDVETRWSSTYLMIERALVLRDAIDQFLLSDEFTDLRKYTIHCQEWKALELFRTVLKVPNAFQHILAKEKTPTIGSALPAFERMRQTWEKMQSNLPESRALIQPGLDKLAKYRRYADTNPTYILATILNPRLKLQWFKENAPDMISHVNGILITELKAYGTQSRGTGEPARASSSSDSSSPTISFEDPEDILGMRVSALTAQTPEEELEAYLQEALEASDLLRYWERADHNLKIRIFSNRQWQTPASRTGRCTDNQAIPR